MEYGFVGAGASASDRAWEKEGVQGDELPEAVAGGVRARGAERPAAGADGGSGPVPRAAAPARGAHARAERRVVVLRRRVPAPVAAVQADAEPHGPARPGRCRAGGRGVAAAAGERRAQDGAAAAEDAHEGPAGAGPSDRRRSAAARAATAAEEVRRRRWVYEQRVQEAREAEPVRASRRHGRPEGAHEAAQESEALDRMVRRPCVLMAARFFGSSVSNHDGSFTWTYEWLNFWVVIIRRYEYSNM